MMRNWLIIYDIRNPRRLGKVAKAISGYAIRVQKSVFEAVEPVSVIKDLIAQVLRIMKDEDYVVYFELCEKDWQKMMKYGKGSRGGVDESPLLVL